MTKQNLTSDEYKEYFKIYIDKVPDSTSLKSGFEADEQIIFDFFSSIDADKLEFRYQPSKWTIKEIFQHIIDTERIFMYRFLRISRQDKTPMSGYEQDDYIAPSNVDSKTMDALLQEFTATRMYSKNLIESISDENLKNIGIISGAPMSARACAFTLLGHSIWHIDVIKERYL